MRFLILSTFLLTGCVGGFSSKPACNGVKSNTGSTLKQPVIPVEVSVDSSVSLTMKQMTLEAIDRWNSELGREVLLLVEYRTNNLVTVPTKWLGQDDNTMYANISYGSRYIYKSTIYINSFYWGDYYSKDFVNVMVHELGHILGLDHVEPEDELMYYAYKMGSNPSMDLAVKSIKCLYKF